jgi:thiaminase/transcriptional activator TenA
MSFARSLKNNAYSVWEAGYNHPFVQELGRGTLAKDSFKFYLLQDYHYLLNYAKAFALAAVKADSEELMAKFAFIQHIIFNQELNLHREYCKGFGITKEEMNSVKPSLYNRTYTANLLAVGETGDLAELLAAVLPCGWTYHDYACRLKIQYADNLIDNFFKSWIDNYSSSLFEESFGSFYSIIDDLCANKTPAQLERVEEIFRSSVEFEFLFFDMAYKQEMGHKL